MPYKIVRSANWGQDAVHVMPEIVATHKFRGIGGELQVVRKYHNDLLDQPLPSGLVLVQHAAGVIVCGIVTLPKADPAGARRLATELAGAVLAGRRGRAVKAPAQNAAVWRNLHEWGQRQRS